MSAAVASGGQVSALLFTAASITAALIGGVVAPASAEAAAADPNRNRYCDSVDPRPPSTPGPEFDVGNGLTAQVNIDIETVSVRSEAGPMWDSTIPQVDRYAIGLGWTMGEAFVEAAPYPKVYVPGHGVLTHDASKVSGLACYDGRDVSFRWGSGTVPARGEFPERAYEYSLAHFDETDLETPTRTDYFDTNGEVMTTVHADGARTDRVYNADQPQRPTRIVHEDGRETTFAYPDEYFSTPLAITSPDGRSTTFEIHKWWGPVEIFSPIGSTRFTWTSMGPMHALRSEDVDGFTTRLADFEWSPNDTGRLSQLLVDGERVFPAEPTAP